MDMKPQAVIKTQMAVTLTISGEQAADLRSLLGAIAGASEARDRTFTPVYYALCDLKGLPEAASYGGSHIARI